MKLPVLAPEAVAAWQMAELRRTLAWARATCPFHAARLAGVDLETLRTAEDLARLPRMAAADLASPGLLAVSQDEVARVVSLNTSGSSGPPKRLHFSESDLTRTLDFFSIGMNTLAGPGDAVLVLLPGRREWGVTDLLARALPDIGARAVLPPETWTAAELPEVMGKNAVTCLIAAPSQLRALLGGPREAFLALRAVLSSAEPLPDSLRRDVESAWDCEVFDHWGMTETGYGGGVECSAHQGYHLREADLLVEVADPETGAPLPPGATGELLVTTLGERAMPLVRYQTGDAARWLPGPCRCGSPLRRLGCVPGRIAADGSITQPKKGGGSINGILAQPSPSNHRARRG
jgi:phenylacetate-coenzyme A ligase PaaK-like adenylate-forming protein